MAVVQQFQIQTSSCGKSCHRLHHLGLKPKIHRKKTFQRFKPDADRGLSYLPPAENLWAMPTLRLDGTCKVGIAHTIREPRRIWNCGEVADRPTQSDFNDNFQINIATRISGDG
jgi:hypothetical protein